jgi:hypothetical protein
MKRQIKVKDKQEKKKNVQVPAGRNRAITSSTLPPV